MIVLPFKPSHLEHLQLQVHQARAAELVTGEYLEALHSAGPALTIARDGEVLLCAGVAALPGRMPTLWGFVSRRSGRHLLAMIRTVRRYLAALPYRAIEATTESDFPPGGRALELLGFQQAGPLPGYGPGGEDHIRYVRSR